MNLKAEARNSPEAKALVGLLQLPERHPSDNLDKYMLSVRLLYQANLRAILHAINRWGHGFPLLLRNSSQVSMVVPRIGAIVADIMEQRNLAAVHAHYSVRCTTQIQRQSVSEAPRIAPLTLKPPSLAVAAAVPASPIPTTAPDAPTAINPFQGEVCLIVTLNLL